jgi:hypothetical protein
MVGAGLGNKKMAETGNEPNNPFEINKRSFCTSFRSSTPALPLIGPDPKEKMWLKLGTNPTNPLKSINASFIVGVWVGV